MSPAQQRGLALWAALLSAVVCLWFLPASRLVSILVLLAVLGLIIAFWAVACRRVQHDFTREAIAESLVNFLRPQLAEIVHRVARQGSQTDKG